LLYAISGSIVEKTDDGVVSPAFMFLIGFLNNELPEMGRSIVWVMGDIY
jgi:hypothetical protein